MVKMFDIVPLTGDIKDLPESNVPYFVPTKEDFYLRKQTALGPCMLPVKGVPNLKSMGDYKKGYFSYTAPDVPKEIISQALDFFRKTFNRLKSEAAVLILLKDEEFRLFPPYQIVDHGGVSSLFDEAEIPEGFTVIGTIHSHCDFDAFHSGTDDSDASDFNGLHITIGHVNTKKPSFASMIMVNDTKFTFTISDVADVSDLNAANSLDEWNGFVFKTAQDMRNANIKFKTLTSAEVNDFLRKNTPIGYASSTSKNDAWRGWSDYLTDDDDDWRGRTTKYLSETRWSEKWKRSLPSNFFETGNYGSKLRHDAAKVVLKEELEKLFALASEYDIYLDFEITDMEKSKKA